MSVNQSAPLSPAAHRVAVKDIRRARHERHAARSALRFGLRAAAVSSVVAALILIVGIVRVLV